MARVNLITEDASGLVAASKLPLATSSTKGAVMPVAATAAMTQDVGVDSDGKLWTAPGGGGTDNYVWFGFYDGATVVAPITIVTDSGYTIVISNDSLTINGVDIVGYSRSPRSNQSSSYPNASVQLKGVESFTYQFSGIYDPSDPGTNRITINGVGTTIGTDYTVHTVNITDMITKVDFTCDACLSPSTIISTPSGTTVLASLRDGDEILSVNERGEIVTDRVVNCDSLLEKYGNETDVWTFDDGTVLETIHPHEFFSADEQKFKYIADFRIGERIVKADGTKPALVKHEVIPGKARHMTLFTERYNTYFANGVLTGNRHSVKFTKEM